MKFKYFLRKFSFLRTYFSPFKRLKPEFYFGKVKVGTPIFLPRRWRNYTKEEATKLAKEKDKKFSDDRLFESRYQYYLNCQHAIPKKIGFDFVGLMWKTKWSSTDFRHEFNPVWSFVFFGWQIAIIWDAPFNIHYWEAWLTYRYVTDRKLSTKERIKLAREITPNIWESYDGIEKETTDYWDKILKNKYICQT